MKPMQHQVLLLLLLLLLQEVQEEVEASMCRLAEEEQVECLMLKPECLEAI
jgi:hypothetical protein